jgi:ribosomal protein S18 acetylase RimI-like enzyme
MTWRRTDSRAEFEAAAGQLLRSDPVRHTVPLTVLDALSQGGETTFGDGAPVFGWHESAAGGPDGAFLQTPPFPVLVAEIPAGSAAGLIELLTAGNPGAVNLAESAAAEFSAAWAARTGGSTAVHLRMRLHRLAGLILPDPLPPGAARTAAEGDYDLLVKWSNDFHAETGAGRENADRTVADRLSYGGICLWEDGGLPVSMAGLTRTVAGVARVAAVYTPPEHRRRGYAGAVTTAVTEQALTGGATEVVLFTDLANPTSNALYRRLGFRPVADRIDLVLQ